MLRTAFPFGYLLIALLFLAAFISGVAIFFRGWRRHSYPAKFIGFGLCAIVVTILIADNKFNSDLEWNPTISGDSEVIGTWAGDGQTITLTLDHTYTDQSATQTTNGTWTRNDWNLYLLNGSNSRKMRFVQFQGQYRLMTQPPNDPDAWDGEIGLNLVHR